MTDELLADVCEFAHPVASRGYQGLFDVPDFLVEPSLRAVCDPA